MPYAVANALKEQFFIIELTDYFHALNVIPLAESNYEEPEIHV